MNRGLLYILNLLFAGVLTIGITAPADAGYAKLLWDFIKNRYTAFQLGEVDEASIPETPVEYAGEIGLTFQGQVELAFDDATPAIGQVRWMGITPDDSLILSDFISGEAYEFSLDDGHYMRSFGRKGQGPGEYLGASSLAVDPKGYIYVHDVVGGQVLHYDRQGNYLDKVSWIGGGRIIWGGRTGGLFFLGENLNNIFQLQKRITDDSWTVQYTIPLSTKKQGFLACRMSLFAQVSYSPTLDRLYYLGPNDDKVKEIEAESGKIVRQFGLFVSQPVVKEYRVDPESRELEVNYSPSRHNPNYVPLPDSHSDIGCGSLEDMRTLHISEVMAMLLLADRYLLVFYHHPSQPRTSRIIYDLKAGDDIKAYSFDEKSSSVFIYLKEYSDVEHYAIGTVGGTQVAAWQDRLYIYQTPLPKDAERSNGVIKVYTLSNGERTLRKLP